MLVTLGKHDVTIPQTDEDLLTFFDRIRYTIRDYKQQANGLIDIHILHEFIAVITTTTETTTNEPSNTNDDEIVEMVLRCMINALCDNETATTIFLVELQGINILVTLLHHIKTSTIAYQITKMIYMMISQFEKIAMPLLLCWRLIDPAQTSSNPHDTSNVINDVPITIADVFITHLEQCQNIQTVIDTHELTPIPPPPPPSGQTNHLHANRDEDNVPVHCSGEYTLHPIVSLLLLFFTTILRHPIHCLTLYIIPCL